MNEKVKIVLLTAVLLIISFAVNAIISVNSLEKAVESDKADISRLKVTDTVDSIDDYFNDKVSVVRTMSKSKYLADLLAKNSTVAEPARESAIKEYLIKLNVGMGLSSAFVISDNSRIFYTPAGKHRVMDVKDEKDSWYGADTSNGKDFAVGISSDERDYKGTMIYVDSPIRDSNGVLLGICGIVIEPTALQKTIQDMENKHSLSVYIVDESGKIRVASDTTKVNTDCPVPYAETPDESGLARGEQEINGEVKAYTSQKLEALGWYVVTVGKADAVGDVTSSLMVKHAVAAVIIFIIFVLSIRGIISTNNKKNVEVKSYRDKLTGLYNRNYVNVLMKGKDKLDTRRFRSLAIMDIDMIKQVNETAGHNAGNVALRSVAYLLREIVGRNGVAFRWEGDTFVVLFNVVGQESGMLCEELRRRVEQETNVTISVGITNLKPRDTMESAADRADKGLVQVKNAGKNKVFMVR